MKTILFTLFACLFLGDVLFAQHAKFITSGSIEFEKSINMYALMKSDMDENYSFDKLIFEAYQKNNPQFKKMKSVLIFGDNKSLFTPVVVEENNNNQMTDDVYADQFNTTYSDLSNRTTVIHKDVYGEEFLVKDTLRKIKWKLTDETKQIAGYTCRRANGIIMDSVYVVAFYTNKIPVSGGPEGFTGLPGMILGVALPHESMNWFATKVTDMPEPASAIMPPKKGKAMNRKQISDAVKSAMKNWGKYGRLRLKLFLL